MLIFYISFGIEIALHKGKMNTQQNKRGNKMNIEKLEKLGGKEWIVKSEIQAYDVDCSNRKIIHHRIYFNNRDDMLEAAGIEGFGQSFYFDIINKVWGGELCTFEIDKMNEFYK